MGYRTNDLREEHLICVLEIHPLTFSLVHLLLALEEDIDVSEWVYPLEIVEPVRVCVLAK